MGLTDLFSARSPEERSTKAALEAAVDPGVEPGPVDRLVTMLVDVGLAGRGPLRSTGGDVEKAIGRLAREATMKGGVGGFVTGIGGFVTMPVALPVNVAEFYLLAVRMVGGIATLRGYDIDEARVRTAVLLTLVGADADEVLRKAGMATRTGRLTSAALGGMPPAVLMVVNKAVGFQLMRGVSQKLGARLGRGVPVVGGVIGGGIDGFMMKKIADHAMKEFPRV